MKYVNLSVLFLGYVIYVFGGSAPLEDDLTILIDYTKYREMFPIERNQSERDARQLSDEGLFPGEVFADQPFIEHEHDGPPPHHESEHHEHEPSVGVCHDSKNEVYQQCGSKCVLGCRYAAASSSGISVSKNDCNKNDCVEGCFCKTGLVRHQTKCIPALECPIRKCHHRDEVYMCGPAAPITCDNATRGKEIAQLTKHVECVWNCFCANGYLRNNYNGKCVPESECRSNKIVEVSPQIPGLFKHFGHGAGPVIYHAGQYGPGHGYGSSYGNSYGSSYSQGGHSQGGHSQGGHRPSHGGNNGYGNSGDHINHVFMGGNIDHSSPIIYGGANGHGTANTGGAPYGGAPYGGAPYGGGGYGPPGYGHPGQGHPGQGHPGNGYGPSYHYYYGTNGTGTNGSGGGACIGTNNCNGVNNGVGNVNNGSIAQSTGVNSTIITAASSTRLSDSLALDPVQFDDESGKSNLTEISPSPNNNANVEHPSDTALDDVQPANPAVSSSPAVLAAAAQSVPSAEISPAAAVPSTPSASAAPAEPPAPAAAVPSASVAQAVPAAEVSSAPAVSAATPETLAPAPAVPSAALAAAVSPAPAATAETPATAAAVPSAALPLAAAVAPAPVASVAPAEPSAPSAAVPSAPLSPAPQLSSISGLVSDFVLNTKLQLGQKPSNVLPSNFLQDAISSYVSGLNLNTASATVSPSNPQSGLLVSTVNIGSLPNLPLAELLAGGPCSGMNNCNNP